MKLNTIQYLAEGGEQQLNDSIGNLNGTVQLIGVSILGIVFTFVAIAMMFGAFSDGGALKKHLSRVAVALVAALLLGGGAALGPMFIDIGGNTPAGGGQEQVQPDGSVN